MIPNKHHRRSIRLKDYDYSQSGAYFVTLCSYHRECLFGEIVGEEIELNAVGCLVYEEWLRTQAVRPYVILDHFVVMPNHMHGIIFLTDDHEGKNVGATCQVAPTIPNFAPLQQSAQTPTGPKRGSVGAIIAQFKRVTTLQINKLRDVESSTPV